MSFGENLTNLRRQKGWSQDDLANNLDLSRQAISKWENETSKPDIDNIKKISKIFSIKIDDLINNELPDDKAVTLDVKKEEKREKIITIIKLMIIAVIILYVISVIYKFASLLVIVNGVQKYANLNNYHYVIKSYNNNEISQKEECWFKDGKSKTILTTYYDSKRSCTIVTIDYKQKKGTILEVENNKETEIDMDNYLSVNYGYEEGKQLFYQFPAELRKNNPIYFLIQSFSIQKCKIDINDKNIILKANSNFINIDGNNFLPNFFYYQEDISKNNILKTYSIELNSVKNI